MDISSINWLAVLVVVIVNFVIQSIWFGPKTFFPVCWKAMGKPDNEVPGGGLSMATVFGSILVAQSIQAAVLSMVISALDTNVLSGAGVGFLLGVGLAASPALGHRLMGGHGFKVWGLEVGADVIGLTVSGAILGLWL